MSVATRIRSFTTDSDLKVTAERYQRLQAHASARRSKLRAHELEARLIRALARIEELEAELAERPPGDK